MMSCDEARALLALHPDADGPEDVRAAVEAHLRGCAACAAEHRRLQESWEALGAWDGIAPSPDFVSKVRARVGRASAAARPVRPARWLPLAAAAGILLAVTAVALFRTAQPIALSPADIEIVQDLDLLENYDMAEAIEMFSSDASLDEVEPLLDLLHAPAEGTSAARKAREY